MTISGVGICTFLEKYDNQHSGLPGQVKLGAGVDSVGVRVVGGNVVMSSVSKGVWVAVCSGTGGVNALLGGLREAERRPCMCFVMWECWRRWGRRGGRRACWSVFEISHGGIPKRCWSLRGETFPSTRTCSPVHTLIHTHSHTFRKHKGKK